MKGVASGRFKHLQSVEGGKHVLVAKLLWSSTLGVITLPVGAELSFATYVLHLGRLVIVPSETKMSLMRRKELNLKLVMRRLRMHARMPSAVFVHFCEDGGTVKV